MNLLLVLSCLVAVQAGITKREASCKGPVISGVHYTDELLKDDIDKPYSLTSDFKNDIIYFGVGSINFKTAKIDLNTKEFSYLVLNGVINAFANSVDQQTGDVYVGGENGVHKYIKATGQSIYVGVNDTDIWGLFNKDGIVYFTDFSSSFLYTIVHEEKSRFEPLNYTKVKDIVIDNDDTIFFTIEMGYNHLYSQKKGTTNNDRYEGSEDNSIRSLSINPRGDVFAALEDGIYAVNKEKHVIEKILDVNNCTGVAFDSKNNIIYSDMTSVHRLQPSDDQSCV